MRLAESPSYHGAGSKPLLKPKKEVSVIFFTQKQLRFVKRSAKLAKRVGGDERSVDIIVRSDAALVRGLRKDPHFTPAQLGIVRFCAQECKRQNSGPLSVYWMVTAYQYAVARHEELKGVIPEGDVIELLRLIEPDQNAHGYRHVPVTLGQKVIGWEHIEQRMRRLIQFQDHLDPLEFYIELEETHPAVDGNGRLGAILINWKRGTLLKPTKAPKVKFRQ